MRLAATALLLALVSWALPLSAGPIFDLPTPANPRDEGRPSSRGGSQANVDLSGLPSATNGLTNPGAQHAAGSAPVFNSVVVVPEPGTLSVLILGLGLLLVARKRRAMTHNHQ